MTRPNIPGRRPDPSSRAALGAAALAVTVAMLNRKRVGKREAQIFHVVNALPDQAFPPVWAIMQLGTLAAAPAAAAIALATGRQRVATRLLISGTVTWALSKVVKRAVRRPRPAELLPSTRIRGREATGLGYVSGHAGVALVLVMTAWPELSPSARIASIMLVPSVGAARVYVGAHLPLDVAGGFALGVTVDALVELALAHR
jgi:glycosyltransferase 2 family protein